jgi:hypothetical protein
MITDAILTSIINAIIGDLVKNVNLVESSKKLLQNDPQTIAVKIALAKSFRQFQRQYPRQVDSLFDEHFLQHQAAPVLATCFIRYIFWGFKQEFRQTIFLNRPKWVRFIF